MILSPGTSGYRVPLSKRMGKKLHKTFNDTRKRRVIVAFLIGELKKQQRTQVPRHKFAYLAKEHRSTPEMEIFVLIKRVSVNVSV